jgi:hypothetical protein
VDRSHVDRKIEDGLHSNELQFVALICQDSTYKNMSSDDVLERIMNHKINIQEVNNIKNLYKGVSTSRNKILLSKETKARRRKF